MENKLSKVFRSLLLFIFVYSVRFTCDRSSTINETIHTLGTRQNHDDDETIEFKVHRIVAMMSSTESQTRTQTQCERERENNKLFNFWNDEGKSSAQKTL